MRLFNSFLVALTALLVAGSAAATVTVNHSTSAASTTLNVGDSIAIQVRISWDGQGQLQGVFSSTAADSSVLAGESAVSGANLYRGSIFAFTDLDTGDSTSLGRFGQGQLRQAVDPVGVVRSIQYGSLVPIQAGGAASNVLVTTITFRAVAPGTTSVGYFLAPADTGAQGDSLVVGTSVTVTVNPIPEPGTALLMGLGLAGLGLAGRRS